MPQAGVTYATPSFNRSAELNEASESRGDLTCYVNARPGKVIEQILISITIGTGDETLSGGHNSMGNDPVAAPLLVVPP